MHKHFIRSSGGRRLRSIHRLFSEEGSPGLIYDLERTFIIEVPPALAAPLNNALQLGDVNQELREWLIHEDLLTNTAPSNGTASSTLTLPNVTDVSIDMSGACNLGCVYCFENDINSRIGPMNDETAMQSVEFAFKKSSGAPVVTLHFGSGEPLLRFDLLKKIVGKAKRLAHECSQRVSFELTTNGSLITPEIAEFFRDEPFNIRVSCDGPPKHQNQFRPLLGGQDSYPAVERGLRFLLEYLPDRLTVNSVLSGGTRLIDLWSWAKGFGVRHYHVIKVGAFSEHDGNLQEEELHEFKADLRAITDDMFSSLEAERIPIDYQPITKIIRRLMIPQPVTRFCGVAGTYLGVASNGKVYPCFRHLGVEEYDLGHVERGANDQKRIQFLRQEAAGVDDRPICQDCWVRYLCGGGCYADSTIYGQDKLKPQVSHCPFWRAEAEAAICFYNRVVRTNPSHCLRLFGVSVDSILNTPTTKSHVPIPYSCS